MNFHLCRVNTCIVQYFSSKFQYQRLYYMYIHCVCLLNRNHAWSKCEWIVVYFLFGVIFSYACPKSHHLKNFVKPLNLFMNFYFFLQTLVKLKIRDIHILEYNSNCPWFNAVFLLSCNIWFQKYVSFWYILFGLYWLHKIFLEDDICQEAFFTSVNMKSIC